MTDFALPEELEQLRETAARFAAAELAPAARASEKAGRWPGEVLDVLRKLALSDLDVPETLGGAGAGCLAKVVLLETLAMGDAGGLAAADQPGIAAGALAACPDVDLARRLARECLAGESQVALLVADRAGPTSHGVAWAPSWPKLRFVFVNEGDVLRLVEVTGALEPARALAFQASGGVSTRLAGAKLLGEWRLAPPNGVALRGRARLWCAAVAVGVAQAAFDATIAYAKDRIVFGKPVAHHQGNAFELAVAATHLQGARLAVRDAAASFDRGAADAGFWASQSWLGAIDAAVTVTDLGIQLLGGHGFLIDHLAEKRFREARMLGLLAGGRDAAEADVADLVLDVPDALA